MEFLLRTESLAVENYSGWNCGDKADHRVNKSYQHYLPMETKMKFYNYEGRHF